MLVVGHMDDVLPMGPCPESEKLLALLNIYDLKRIMLSSVVLEVRATWREEGGTSGEPSPAHLVSLKGDWNAIV